nr:MAG TPA: hypothetical protein [Caudoviricetes sp.]
MFLIIFLTSYGLNNLWCFPFLDYILLYHL